MYANYHTHTFRCGHATGTDEAFIKAAIDCGLMELGFSDHAPFRFPNGRETGNRIPTSMAEDYIFSLKALKEKYKNKIRIHIGFEMEYYPLYFEEMYSYTKALGAEYFILGQHFIKNEIPDLIDSNEHGHTAEQLSEYTKNIIGGIRTGKFLYVAHPDFFRFEADDALYSEEMTKICIEAKNADIPLELNLHNICQNPHFSGPIFLEAAAKIGNRIIFGMDAHAPHEVFVEASLNKGMYLVQKYHLNLIDRLDIHINSL
ncbi:MAG: PHP domain-containing protein [Ruminococcaceae bacterium]|nr:PHP domain-containing protein [Oscillospiraceae bacterium]